MEGVGEMSDFWAGKRVFLTGNTGFNGSWLALWLQHLGVRVTGYAVAPPPAEPRLFETARVGAGMESILGDVTNYDHFVSTPSSAAPDSVIHMAAQSLVRYFYVNPDETDRTNVMGMVHLLQAVQQVNWFRAVLNISSGKWYENRKRIWGYRESDRLGGRDSHRNSKARAELVSSAFRDSFFHSSSHVGHAVTLATARAGNVMGGDDWGKGSLVPDILRAAAAGKVVEIRSATSIRLWQHVLDPLSGYLALAERLFTDSLAFADNLEFRPSRDRRPFDGSDCRLPDRHVVAGTPLDRHQCTAIARGRLSAARLSKSRPKSWIGMRAETCLPRRPASHHRTRLGWPASITLTTG